VSLKHVVALLFFTMTAKDREKSKERLMAAWAFLCFLQIEGTIPRNPIHRRFNRETISSLTPPKILIGAEVYSVYHSVVFGAALRVLQNSLSELSSSASSSPSDDEEPEEQEGQEGQEGQEENDSEEVGLFPSPPLPIWIFPSL
jgi:hypothetical protein